MVSMSFWVDPAARRLCHPARRANHARVVATNNDRIGKKVRLHLVKKTMSEMTPGLKPHEFDIWKNARASWKQVGKWSVMSLSTSSAASVVRLNAVRTSSKSRPSQRRGHSVSAGAPPIDMAFFLRGGLMDSSTTLKATGFTILTTDRDKRAA
jgi:hypothetical protein